MGSAPAVTDLIAGQVQVMFDNTPNVLPHVRAGKLKALGVTGPLPSPLLPGVKPLVEQGFPGLLVFNWYGVLAPAKTPRDVVTKLQGEIRRILHAPDMKPRMQAQGMDPVASSPEEFDAYIRAELARWTEVVRDAGMKPE